MHVKDLEGKGDGGGGEERNGLNNKNLSSGNNKAVALSLLRPSLELVIGYLLNLK